MAEASTVTSWSLTRCARQSDLVRHSQRMISKPGSLGSLVGQVDPVEDDSSIDTVKQMPHIAARQPPAESVS